MIRVEGLCARWGQFELRDVSFAVPAGTSYALLGPSGAGKTLCLETVLGLRPAAAGVVLLGGRPVGALPPERREVAYLPQDLALFPNLSVRENVGFCLQVRGRPEAEVAARVLEVSRLAGVEHLLERPTIEGLSGGERQRVALARALAGGPRCLFLDEPFSALDPERRRELYQEVRRLQRALGFTLLFVTHDLEEASVMADRVALLRDGAVALQGPPAEVFDQPGTAWAARFLLFDNVVAAAWEVEESPGVQRVVLDGAVLRCAGGRPVGSRVTLAWRASRMSLGSGLAGAAPRTFELPSLARERLRLGERDLLCLSPLRATGEPAEVRLLVEVERRAGAAAVPLPGTRCSLRYDPRDVVTVVGEGGAP